MTPEQISLARHALGLPNKRRRSYRNFFMAGPGHRDYEQWMAMVAAGHARRVAKPRGYRADDCFWLTPEGAATALNVGETLDSEDFPTTSGDRIRCRSNESPIVTHPDQTTHHQPPPIGGPRDVDDRLGEALRRWRHGLIRPLWRDMTEADKEGWRNAAASWRVSILADVGLTVGILDR